MTEPGQEAAAPASFDYEASADLYFPFILGRRGGIDYRRFESAAIALAFAVEQLAGARLAATAMEVNGERYDASSIKALYADARFPLSRAVLIAKTGA